MMVESSFCPFLKVKKPLVYLTSKIIKFSNSAYPLELICTLGGRINADVGGILKDLRSKIRLLNGILLYKGIALSESLRFSFKVG